MTTPDQTYKAVQEYYGKAARSSDACCGPEPASQRTDCNCPSGDATEEIQSGLYPAELTAGIPEDIANFSLGSGDPISLAKLQPGETVLDLGSGGGLDCFMAAKLVGEKGHVIGVDMTPDMIARAKANAARLQAATVEFREGYLEALPVEDRSVDVIISNCVINLSPDKPQVFREMMRVLKPGGRIAVSDPVSNHPIPKPEGKTGEDWCGCVSGALDRKQYKSELDKAGFTDISLVPNTDILVKDFQNGRLKLPEGKTIQDALQEIARFEEQTRLMIIPHNITASKA
jgi:SAM-dependent methyltransferase